MSLLTDNTALYNLARTLANANYGNSTGPLELSRVQLGIISHALQGQFAVNFQFPEIVAQAMLLQEQGNVPDFDPTVLSYFRTATQTIFQAFKGTPFVVSGLPNAGGIKVSWSQALASTTVDADVSQPAISQPAISQPAISQPAISQPAK